MTKQELNAFIDRIIASGNRVNVRASLEELKNILEKNVTPPELIEYMDALIVADREMAALGKSKHGAPTTEAELAKAIREGRERKEREDAYRC
ncbi:MAG: hypothetical protein IKN24_06640 [Lachnospiraceae bacterium]|nr:hypothetical protein [Lachnospiraceae bacterium]